jgi:exonuclease SbcD
MSRPVRFLHTADIHLGTPVQGFSGASRQIEAQLMEASFVAWERICDAALAYDVDFVVVAGDLYHREARSVKAARCLKEQVQRLGKAGIMVYAVYGNHDPLGDREELLDMPENFHAFPAETSTFYEVKHNGIPLARVFGVSYRSRRESRRLSTMLSPPDNTLINIGLLHTALDSENRNYSPCSMQDLLEEKYVHYWALGHIHQSRIIRSGFPSIVFPGTPQGRHPGEVGVGGCLLVEVSLDKAPDIRFVPISPFVWQKVELSIAESSRGTAVVNISDVERLLQEKAEELLEQPLTQIDLPEIPLADTSWEPLGYLVRWVLTGRGSAHTALTESENAAEELRGCLDEFQHHKPFLWTESIQIQTGNPLPEWADMVESWPLARQLEAIAAGYLNNEEMKKGLDKALGRIWEVDYDPEHPSAHTLPATPDVMAHILKAAKQLAYEKLLEGGRMS